MPTYFTPFIGRKIERRQIGRLLEHARLVTLSGSGGSGKTRLAYEVAGEQAAGFPDGVWWVDLVPVNSPDLMPAAVTAALRAPEVHGESLTQSAVAAMAHRQGLLVLDNCEHLIDACAGFVEAVLRGCPAVAVLTTSRQRLGVDGEVVFRVPPLSLPGDRLDRLAESEAVQLFVERAARAGTDVHLTPDNGSAVAALCNRLDGMPLAIELAAARVRVLTVREVLEGLDDALNLLTGGTRGVLPRHQTLKASVEWSYRLLAEEEQALLRRLAVFAGGWTLAAAQVVCCGDRQGAVKVLDLLTSLVDKSLADMHEIDGRARYRLLEPIRQYALSRLEDAGEAEELRSRHLRWYADHAAEQGVSIGTASTLEALSTLTAELGNLRSAMDHSLESGQIEQGLRIAGALAAYWFIRGHWTEATTRCDTLLQAGPAPPRARAAGFYSKGLNALIQLDFPTVASCGRAVLELEAHDPDPRVRVLGLYLVGIAAMWIGNWSDGRPALEEALWMARESGADAVVGQILWALGSGFLSGDGDLGSAREHLEEGLALARRLGDPFRTSITLAQLATVEWVTGHLDVVVDLCEEADVLLEALGERSFRAQSLGFMGWVAARTGDHERALEVGTRAVALGTGARSTLGAAWAYLATAGGYAAAGDPVRAIHELERALAVVPMLSMPFAQALVLLEAAQIDLNLGHDEQCDRLLRQAEQVLGRIDNRCLEGQLWHLQARRASAVGEQARARDLAARARARLEEAAAGLWAADADELLAQLGAPAAVATATAAGQSDDLLLRQEGDVWTVGSPMAPLRLRNRKGLHYLAHLLAHPGREFHALDLVGEVEGTAGAPVDVGDAGPLLDSQAKAAYRRRVHDLEEEMEEAERFRDGARAERARSELEALTEQLAAAVGLGGRDRVASSAAERARVKVTRLIRETVRHIGETDPVLGRLLDDSVRTGVYCSYDPPPGRSPSWLL